MKKLLPILSLIAFLTVPGLKSVGQNQSAARRTADAVIVDAVQDIESGRYDNVEVRLLSASRLDPENDAVPYYLGILYHYQGKEDESERMLKEAVRLDSSNYWYRDRLAAVYALNGKEDKAIEVYEALLADYPKKTDLYYSLVNLYAQQDDMEKVLETLDSIETIAGRDESTVLARYDVLMRMDKADDAFGVLAAFNEDFSSPQILSMMGDAKLTADQDSLALAYYAEALAIEPDYTPALLGRAEVYRLRREYDDYFSSLGSFASSQLVPTQVKSQYLTQLSRMMDAHFARTYQPQLDTLYETCVRTHPNDSSVLVTAGTYFFRSERPERAKQLFRHNASLYPGCFDAVGLYIQALNFSEDWEALAEASDEAFGHFPDEPAFLEMKLAAHYNMGDYRAVVADALRMASEFPDDTTTVLTSLSTAGDCYHMLGDTKQAFRYYEKALKLDPRYSPVLNNYAYYLSVMGKRLGKAYNMSKLTIEQEPDNATYLDTFAWILHLQGKNLEAKSFFKHAMLYGGKESSTILEHYAEVLKALGEDDLAKVYYDQAAKKKSTEQ